jgi:hypothetical protein
MKKTTFTFPHLLCAANFLASLRKDGFTIYGLTLNRNIWGQVELSATITFKD